MKTTIRHNPKPVNPSFYKNAFRGALVVFGFLLIHALVFFKERIILPDSAFYLFEMAYSGNVAIMHNRFIAVFPEVLPLLGFKNGLSLSLIMKLYSVAFPLYYLACYVVCGWVFKNYRIALALVLSLILVSTHTQYWMISELGLGMAMFYVVLAWLSSDTIYGPFQQIMLWLFTFLLLIIITWAHPLLIFPIGYALLFFWLKGLVGRRKLLIIGLGYLGLVIIKFIFFKESYESSAFSNLGNVIRLFPDYFNTHTNRLLLKNCVGIWWSIPLGFLAVAWTYFSQKEWQKLTLFTVSMLGYLALINISYPGEDVLAHYVENFYLVLGFFIALPLVYDVFPLLAKKSLALPVLSILILLCLVRIWMGHSFYTARLDWERGLIKKANGRKLIIESATLPKDTLLDHWCIPYEIWLLSTVEQQSTASITVRNKEGILPGETSGDSRQFVCTWVNYPYTKLKPPYFLFKDTVGVYEH